MQPGDYFLTAFGALRRTVHGKEAQAVDRHVVEVVKRVRQQLAGALRGGVGGDGMLHPILFGKRHRFVVAVDRGGPVDERVDVEPLGDLQHRLRAAHVHALVGARRFDGGTHPGLGRRMDECIDLLRKQGLANRARVADVRFDECKSLSGKVLDAFLLDAAGGDGIEVVDGNDAGTVRKEAAVVRDIVPEHVLLDWLDISRKTLKRWGVPVNSEQGQTRSIICPP